jgi:hypothetical protein
MLTMGFIRYDDGISRRIVSIVEKIRSHPVFDRPFSQCLKIPADLLIVEVWLRIPMTLDPVESHNIYAPRTSQCLRKQIETVIDMRHVQLRPGAWPFFRLVVVRVRDFSAELVQAVHMMEDVHACEVCVWAEMELGRRFNNDGRIFAQLADFFGRYYNGRDVASYRFPGCIGFSSRASSPNRWWISVPKGPVGTLCDFGDFEAVKYRG